jgi:hypothetical protein
MNTRKDNNGKALEAWRAIAPGHIAKPLRHIAARDNRQEVVNGEIKTILGPRFLQAQAAANIGRGDWVQSLARSMK